MQTEEAGVAMAEVARTVVAALVDRPDEVAVVLGREGHLVVLDVTVADCDVGRAIGKEGHTARSLRSIMTAIANRHGVRCEFSIVGDRRPSRERVKL